MTSNPCLSVINTVVMYLSYSELKIRSDLKLYSILYTLKIICLQSGYTDTCDSMLVKANVKGGMLSPFEMQHAAKLPFP